MASGEGLVGHECKLYYHTGTNRTSPSLTEITRAMDVEVTIGSTLGTFSSRTSSFQANKIALLTVGLTFGYEYVFGQGDDTVFDALRADALAKTVREFYALDGSSATASDAAGLRFWGQISEMPISQPLEDAVTVQFTIVPVRYVDPAAPTVLLEPDWYDVPAV